MRSELIFMRSNMTSPAMDPKGGLILEAMKPRRESRGSTKEERGLAAGARNMLAQNFYRISEPAYCKNQSVMNASPAMP